ncbi:MAG: cyclic nucleotide-binding domain-containing protein, partial [Planctomycetota bacterium]
ANVFVELESGNRRQVATLNGGDYFGEMALLTGEKRSATVVAATDVECWRLDREGFKQIIERRPEMAQELASLLATRKLAVEVAKQGHETVSRADVERNLFAGISAFFGLAT